ncbi:holo-ACP synthase [Borrelia hermsii]|uniref:Holo-[acyl-carrier-protein] synthase n=3 Tax=Borrelia hermsii TaxID=140 RepID=ACPS_BORHD|nr:4'-phosphopantetheinyl transferase superfamily protein [Borrelia hermsii]B2S1J9.1 RecName: Full=Holo-[acyl-carrier-protein] synthase; Short=Holo-ACP synthase; AltName: Full=4'-phosphopantetheinyl transferase AcpS [Borrelia hermsii DAH]AAX16536.1 holo-[acyl-carrier protein] synthase [Borrelia hermsii DAH]AHH12029.1 Holo-[acyl-carrier protein] synthase [Borrelia hermsii YBT]AJW72847.1 ACP synthase [Borrelia hermsii CC1]AMR75797.1 Holo-[acyl-carrier protein] synthase [Borrelia hermsii]ANA4283
MTKSIGCDIIKVTRFNSFLQNRKKLDRFFTQREIENLEMKGKGILESLAGKFSAKEALIKALSPLINTKIKYSLKDIEIIALPKGNIIFQLHNDIKVLIEQMDLKLYLTISHEREYAIAFVIVED